MDYFGEELLQVVTPPAVPAVPLADMKLHIQVQTSARDDLISAQTNAAITYAESYTQQSYINRTYAWTLDYFPSRVIFVPRPPVVSVASVTYLDVNGTDQTLDPTLYTVIAGNPGRLAFNPGKTIPHTYRQVGSVTINYTAGYGADATTVPPNVVAAIKLLTAHWYRNRESTIDSEMIVIPHGVKDLLDISMHGGW